MAEHEEEGKEKTLASEEKLLEDVRQKTSAKHIVGQRVIWMSVLVLA